MQGSPSDFETIGTRLGFRVVEDGPERCRLVWHGARFPAFLCLGIALALLSISVPIIEALRQRGFQGPASSLWYFPLMNLILLGIGVYLLSVKRVILFDHERKQIDLQKRSIFRTRKLPLPYETIAGLRLGNDQVYSGFALAGSTAAQKYPVPSLRLLLKKGGTVLLDRGGMRRLEILSRRIATFIERPLEIEGNFR